jgi:uncharacterized membrane protein YsdA (DUF1294 family)
LILRYGFAAFCITAVLAGLLAAGLGLGLLAAWLLAANLAAFGFYGYDKSIAGSGRMRVPEAVLLGLGGAGGTPGAWLGMRLFHHKTLKTPFQLKFWGIAALQLLATGYLWWAGLLK